MIVSSRHVLLVFVSSFLFTLVGTISWTSKEKHRTWRVATMHAQQLADVWQCEDDYSNCKYYKNYCGTKIVRETCRYTCGNCHRVYADCSTTTFGCCWDNQIVAKGPDFKGCKPCVDELHECKHHKHRCNGPNARRVRLTCPVTCNIGYHKQCKDDPLQEPICQLYKRFMFCKASPELMQKICAKTCNYC